MFSLNICSAIAYERDYPSASDLTDADKTKIDQRVKSLGVGKLVNNNYELDGRIHHTQVVRDVQTNMLKKAKKIRTPLFVTKSDVKRAVDFLELFAWHTQISAEHQNPGVVAKKAGGWAITSIALLEHLLEHIKDPSAKKVLQPTVKRLLRTENKLFETLGPVEQAALIGKVRTAQKTLKRYFR